MSPKMGTLIDGLLKKNGLLHRDLAERCGFTTNYVSNVISKQEGSFKFVKAVEEALDLEAGSLVQWNLLEVINKICRKEGIALDDAVVWIDRAATTFRAVRSGNDVPENVKPSHDPKGPAAASGGQAAAEEEDMTEIQSFIDRLTSADGKHYVNYGVRGPSASTPFFWLASCPCQIA
jgi:transcriptional regulator with XRE-family HTH domain